MTLLMGLEVIVWGLFEIINLLKCFFIHGMIGTLCGSFAKKQVVIFARFWISFGYFFLTAPDQANSLLELLMGVEPMTPSLPRRCSTTELQQQRFHEKAGDGDRTRTTSLEGWSSTIELHPQADSSGGLKKWPYKKNGGERRIRTFEGVANGFTVHPLWPLRYLSMLQS